MMNCRLFERTDDFRLIPFMGNDGQIEGTETFCRRMMERFKKNSRGKKIKLRIYRGNEYVAGVWT